MLLDVGETTLKVIQIQTYCAQRVAGSIPA